MSRDVSSTFGHSHRFKVRNVSGDQRYFSGTADSAHGLNSLSFARPMRGGIRL